MKLIIPDLPRAIVSGVKNILLLFSLARPKYNKTIMRIAMVITLIVNVLFCLTFYLSGNLTALAKYDAILFLLLLVAIKPLFLDDMMQWLFNIITVINVFAIILILSFYLCYYLPYPPYAVTLLRFIFFVVVILLFQRRLRPLYWEVVDSWKVFILMVVVLFANIMYYFMFSSDIIETLTVQFVPLLLLILLSTTSSVIRRLRRRYRIRPRP